MQQVIAELGEPDKNNISGFADFEYLNLGLSVIPGKKGLVQIVLCVSPSGPKGPFRKAFAGHAERGMDAEQVETAAQMLPDMAALIPVEAQSPKHAGQTGFASGRNVQPNSFADNLGNLILPRQPCPQIIQNRIGGQSAVGAMPNKIRLRLAGF